MTQSKKRAAHAPIATAKPDTQTRRPGRPAGRASGPEQRDHLVDKALILFAKQGIADTTLAAIAREAGVTSAMMSYYFKTRDQLIDVIMAERLLPIRSVIGEVFEADDDDPVIAITRFAQRLMQTAIDHPWFAPLWVHEVINEGGQLNQRMQSHLGDAQNQGTNRCFRRWQREGRLNAELDPTLMFTSLIGLVLLPFATTNHWRMELAQRRTQTAGIARHAIALLVHGLGVQTAAT